MIAIDTNILVRYIMRDDGEQTELATRLLEAGLTEQQPGFVSSAVICETIWVLTRKYDLGLEIVGEFLENLLSARQIVLQDAAAVAKASQLIDRHDVANILIHETGQTEGCHHTVTFDRKFARLEKVELLTS